jgi:hypothetical protein
MIEESVERKLEVVLGLRDCDKCVEPYDYVNVYIYDDEEWEIAFRWGCENRDTFMGSKLEDAIEFIDNYIDTAGWTEKLEALKARLRELAG